MVEEGFRPGALPLLHSAACNPTLVFPAAATLPWVNYPVRLCGATHGLQSELTSLTVAPSTSAFLPEVRRRQCSLRASFSTTLKYNKMRWIRLLFPANTLPNCLCCRSHHWSCSSVPNFALTLQSRDCSAPLFRQPLVKLVKSVLVKQYLLLNK